MNYFEHRTAGDVPLCADPSTAGLTGSVPLTMCDIGFYTCSSCGSSLTGCDSSLNAAHVKLVKLALFELHSLEAKPR